MVLLLLRQLYRQSLDNPVGSVVISVSIVSLKRFVLHCDSLFSPLVTLFSLLTLYLFATLFFGFFFLFSFCFCFSDFFFFYFFFFGWSFLLCLCACRLFVQGTHSCKWLSQGQSSWHHPRNSAACCNGDAFI